MDNSVDKGMHNPHNFEGIEKLDLSNNASRAVPRITTVIPESADLTPRRNAVLIPTQEQLKQNPELLKERNIHPDLVNRPPHYKDGGIEVIDYIEAKKLNYNIGNAVKYLSRAGKKDKDFHIQDLEKAVWYIQREIFNIQREIFKRD